MYSGSAFRRLAAAPSPPAAGFAQHPAADRDDQAGLLGEGDEVARADEPALGVLPAQQRLDAAITRPSEQPHDRLVVQLELAALECALQVGPQLEAREHARVHLGLEQRGSRPCRRAWRCTWRRRRRGSARRRRRRSRVEDRDADAAAQRQLLAGDRRAAGAGRRACARRPRRRSARPSRSSSRTTNSSPPKRAAVSLERMLCRQALGDVDQGRVARAVAEAVVDRLEVVDVEEHHAELALLAPRAADRVAHALDEQARGWAGS